MLRCSSAVMVNSIPLIDDAVGAGLSGIDDEPVGPLTARCHGIMQVLPSTARALKVSGIGSLENNVHAGTKYMRHMMDTYFDDEALDEDNRVLFTLAAYNAGPNRIAQLRKEAIRRGLDGNVWFGNVERVAALRVGSETVQYVKMFRVVMLPIGGPMSLASRRNAYARINVGGAPTGRQSWRRSGIASGCQRK